MMIAGTLFLVFQRLFWTRLATAAERAFGR